MISAVAFALVAGGAASYIVETSALPPKSRQATRPAIAGLVVMFIVGSYLFGA
jgi:hypothetical protein